MPVITFTATSSLAPGMIAGQDYSIEIKRNEYDQEVSAERKQVRSLSGKTVTTMHRRDRTWQMSVSSEGEASDKLFCLLDSLLAGATCTFDRDATINTSGVVLVSRPVTCELADDSFKPKRLGMRSDAFQFSFKLREVGQPVYSENYFFDLDFTRGENPDPNYFTYTGDASVPMYTLLNDGKYWPLVDDRPRSHWDHINGRELGAWFGANTTNSLLYSSDFSNAVWVASSCSKASANSIFQSNGVAQKITATAANAFVRQNIDTFTSAVEDTFFAIVERGNSDRASVSIYDVTGAVQLSRVELNFDTGVVTTLTAGTGRAVKLLDVGPNGGAVWIIATTVLPTVGGNARRVQVWPVALTDTNTYGYVHHAQLHASTAINTLIGPPIVTTSAAVTRAGNRLRCTALPAWFNNREYTIAAQIDLHDLTPNSGTSRYLCIVSGTDGSADRSMLYLSGTQQLTAQSHSNYSGGTVYSQGWSGLALGRHKIASRFALNNFGVSKNGQAIKTDLSGNMPIDVTTLTVGDYYAGSNNRLNGYISRAVFAPRAWADAELQAWTA